MVSFAPSRCGRAAALLAACPGCLSACAVGPNFVPPEAPPVGRYTREPLQNPTAADNIRTRQGGSADQSFVSGADIPGQWWTLFHSKALNRLVEQALANNPNSGGRAGLAADRAAERRWPRRARSTRASPRRRRPRAPWRPASTCNRRSTTRPSISTACTRRRRWSRTIPTCSAGTAARSSRWRPPTENQRFQLEAAYLSLTANVVAAADPGGGPARADRRDPQGDPGADRGAAALQQAALARADRRAPTWCSSRPPWRCRSNCCRRWRSSWPSSATC